MKNQTISWRVFLFILQSVNRILMVEFPRASEFTCPVLIVEYIVCWLKLVKPCKYVLPDVYDHFYGSHP